MVYIYLSIVLLVCVLFFFFFFTIAGEEYDFQYVDNAHMTENYLDF